MTCINLRAIKHIDRVNYIDIDYIANDYSLDMSGLQALLKICCVDGYRLFHHKKDIYLHSADYYQLDAAICKLRGVSFAAELRAKWFMQPSAFTGSPSGLYILRRGRHYFGLPVDDSLAGILIDPLGQIDEVVKIIPASYQVAKYASTKYLGGELGKVPYSRNFKKFSSIYNLIADCESAIAWATADLVADPDIVVGGEIVKADDSDDESSNERGRSRQHSHQREHQREHRCGGGPNVVRVMASDDVPGDCVPS